MHHVIPLKQKGVATTLVVRGICKWDAQRVDLMTSLVRAKCDQNPLVLRELQSTGTKIIGESGLSILWNGFIYHTQRYPQVD